MLAQKSGDILIGWRFICGIEILKPRVDIELAFLVALGFTRV
jgi:hypothetical protein